MKKSINTCNKHKGYYSNKMLKTFRWPNLNFLTMCEMSNIFSFNTFYSGADVNAVGYEYSNPTRKRMVTPLYYAVSKSCNKELLRRLISAGINTLVSCPYHGYLTYTESQHGSNLNIQFKFCNVLSLAMHIK